MFNRWSPRTRCCYCGDSSATPPDLARRAALRATPPHGCVRRCRHRRRLGRLRSPRQQRRRASRRRARRRRRRAQRRSPRRRVAAGRLRLAAAGRLRRSQRTTRRRAQCSQKRFVFVLAHGEVRLYCSVPTSPSARESLRERVGRSPHHRRARSRESASDETREAARTLAHPTVIPRDRPSVLFRLSTKLCPSPALFAHRKVQIGCARCGRRFFPEVVETFVSCCWFPRLTVWR